MIKSEKASIVEDLKRKFSDSSACVLTDFKGLNVMEITDLRNRLRRVGARYQVVKNRLALLALDEEARRNLRGHLVGPTAVVFATDRVVEAAKAIVEFARENEKLDIKVGLIEGKVMDSDGIRELANLPPREVLLSRLVGSLQFPLVGLVNVLQGSMRNLIYVLNAIKEKKGSE
ncbi:MAG: 50S ribosomal protein L10 [bacterium]